MRIRVPFCTRTAVPVVLTAFLFSLSPVLFGQEVGDPVESVSTGFEQNIRPWQAYPSASKTYLTHSTAVSFSGRGCLLVNLPDAGERLAVYRLWDGVQAGQRYHLRFRYRVLETSPSPAGTVRTQINFRDESGRNGSAGTLRFSQESGPSSEDWHTFSQLFRAPPDAVGVQLVLASFSGWKGRIAFDEVRLAELEEGVVPPGLEGVGEPVPSVGTGFERNIRPWQAYPAGSKHFLRHTTESPRSGPGCMLAEIPTASDRLAIYRKINAIEGGVRYRLTFFYRVEASAGSPSSKAETVVNFNDASGRNGSAGRERYPLSTEVSGETWRRFSEEFTTPASAEAIQLVLATFSGWAGRVAFDDLQLVRLGEAGENADPFSLTVDRPDAVFAKALDRSRAGGFETGSWFHAVKRNAYAPETRKQYTDETWAREVENVLRESGEAGMYGPSLPHILREVDDGIEGLRAMGEQYGFRFPLHCFGGLYENKAHNAGVPSLMRPNGRYAVDKSDPRYREQVEKILDTYLPKNNLRTDDIAFIYAVDEPLNNVEKVYSRVQNPDLDETLDTIDQEIRETAGFGTYGLPDLYDPERSGDLDESLRRIAFFRWWHERFVESCEQQRAFFRERLPETPYMAANVNHCGWLSLADPAALAMQTDLIGVDPYPTAALSLFGRDRALFHTGFSTKFVHDLGAPARTCVMPQGFIYHGRAPTPANIREWTSQAIKNGAEVLYWYTAGPDRYAIPDAYAEILRMNNLVAELPALRVPDEAPSAIFISTPSRYASNDRSLDAAYSLYALLGERLGTWFRFVNDRTIHEDRGGLEGVRLLLVPKLAYCSEKTAERLIAFVERGGTLVCFDPQALSRDLDGTPLRRVRRRLFGFPLPDEVIEADRLLPAGPGTGASGTLPLLADRRGNRSSYRLAELPERMTVLFRYPDGTPATVERSLGEGRVVTFLAQPFGSTTNVEGENLWDAFLRPLIEQAGGGFDLPLWDFLFPAKGGEIEVRYEVPPSEPSPASAD